MAFVNPDDSTEILYGASGDVRNEINSFIPPSSSGHYADEKQIPGSLIVNSLRKATRLINLYLEPVYADSIPFSTTASVPPQLDEIADDIATFYTLRSSSAKLGPLSDQRKRDYYDQYVMYNPADPGMLVLIRDRKLSIPGLASVAPSEAKSSRRPGRSPIFDVDDTAKHVVDPNLLDDIDRERFS